MQIDVKCTSLPLYDPSNIDKQKAHWRDLPMGFLFVAM
jgi:hypothetical protein